MDTNSEKVELLVKRCQEESPFGTKAFKELVLVFQPSVHRFCYNYIKNENDAEELTQSILLKVYHNIKNFKFESKFKTWLYRIAINQCTDLYNRKKKQAQLKKEMMEYRGEISQKATHADKLTMKDDIGAYLQKMPDPEREILILRFYEDLKVKEISETLEISLSAAKMRLSRAIEHFKVIYDP